MLVSPKLAFVELNSVHRKNRFRVERRPGHALAERAVANKCSHWRLIGCEPNLAAEAATLKLERHKWFFVGFQWMWVVAPNVGVERLPQAVRSNDGLDAPMAEAARCLKRREREPFDEHRRCATASSVGATARGPEPPPACATARDEPTGAQTASAGDECIGAPNVGGKRRRPAGEASWRTSARWKG